MTGSDTDRGGNQNRWFNRPFYSYRKVSVGPKLTNGAVLLVTLFFVAMLGVMWFAY